MSAIRYLVLSAVLSLPFTDALAKTPPASISHYTVERSNPSPNSRKARTWTVWHDARSVEVQENGAPVSVAWERLPSGALQRSDVFHAYKSVIHYTPGDARVLGVEKNWESIPGLFDGSLLKQLQAVGKTMHEGKQGEQYEGAIGKRSYRVIWLNEPGVPALIDIQTNNRHERITLTDTHAQNTTHEQRADWRNQYDDIEYADLGDSETHPLVKALHRQAPHFIYPAH